MTRVTLLAVAAVTTTALFLTAADEPRKKPTDKEMKEAMIRVHRGDASPYAKAEKEATAAEPKWEELAKHLKELSAMSADSRAYNGYSAAPYMKATAGLAKAVADKDAKLASTSFAALRKSCAACHYYGGAKAWPEESLRAEKKK